MRAFDEKQVLLLPGPLSDVLNETASFYRAVHNDDILKYMREEAGLKAPGCRLTGWYPKSRGMGTLGQWISFYCRLYALSGQKSDRDKAIELTEQFWICYDRLQGSSRSLLGNRSFYALEKLVRALLDLQIYAHYSTADQVDRLVSFAEANLDRSRLFGDNGTEWYTLPESFYDAAQLFDMKRAAKVADFWQYRMFWDLFADHKDPFSAKPKAGLYSDFCHAYSHVNSMNSCAMAYQYHKDPYDLKALLSFYQFMQETQVMVTGGYGPEFEHLMPKDRIINALRTGHDSFETQCGSYAAFRLCRYLTEFTKDAVFGDWVESLIYNAVIATPPMTPEGKVLYYSDYNMYGACKRNRKDNWTCCTGTRPLLAVDLARQIYYHDGQDVYVSQYTPSLVTFEREGSIISLRQETDFPLSDETQLKIEADGAFPLTLHLRKPGWLSGPIRLYINEKPIQETKVDKNWVSLSRFWQNGDVISAVLPKSLQMHALDHEKNGPNAFVCGPVVLAASYIGPQTPNDVMDVRKLTERMHPVPGYSLHYTVDGCDFIYFKPYYEFEERERYFIYHDTTAHQTSRFPG